MQKWDKNDLCAVLSALLLLAASVVYPTPPTMAWWGTAYSVTATQSADTQPEKEDEIVLSSAFFEWWRTLVG